MAVVKQIAGVAAIGAAMLIGLSAPSAQAGYIATMTEVGSNVVVNGSGPIDLTGLTLVSSNHDEFSSMWPTQAEIIIGAQDPNDIVGVQDRIYTGGYTGPTSFGSGLPTYASTGSGDSVGIGAGLGHALFVPLAYVSGNPLSDQSIYNNQTLSSLGVTPGTYEWTWGAGVNQNFTLEITSAAVPEPSSLLLLALPLCLLMTFAGRPYLSRLL